MSKHQYRSCPDCGCNLDPGEICDCKAQEKFDPILLKRQMETVMMAKSDALIIGYDFSKGQDLACLTVARKNSDVIQVLHEFFGVEAIKMYENLIQGPSVRYDPKAPDFLEKMVSLKQQELNYLK